MSNTIIYHEQERSSKSDLTGLYLTRAISLSLQVALFYSLGGSNTKYCIFFALVAVAFELTRYSVTSRAAYLYKEQSTNEQKHTNSELKVVCCYFLILFSVSVLCSTGSLVNSVKSLHSLESVEKNQEKINSSIINSIEDEIKQNNFAINRYQQLDKIKYDAKNLKEENKKLRDQLNEINQSTSNIEYFNSNILAAVESIVILTTLTFKEVVVLLSVLIALLIDIGVVYFTYINTTKNFYTRKKLFQHSNNDDQLTDISIEQQTEKREITQQTNTDIQEENYSKITQSTNIVEFTHRPQIYLYEIVKSSIVSGELKPSKRRVIDQFKIGKPRVDEIFNMLEEDKIVFQKPSGRYVLLAA